MIIGDVLGVSRDSIIHKRKFRNHLEHYDERLKTWIKEKGIGAAIGTYNVGPKSMFQIPNMVFISHYDHTNNIFTFVDEDFDLSILYDETIKIKNLADEWVKRNEAGIIIPPFDK